MIYPEGYPGGFYHNLRCYLTLHPTTLSSIYSICNHCGYRRLSNWVQRNLAIDVKQTYNHNFVHRGTRVQGRIQCRITSLAHVIQKLPDSTIHRIIQCPVDKF